MRKHLTGADIIIALFLCVTVPHTSFVLSAFEYREWWWLAWSLAAAIDVGIAYGGLISSSKTADEEAKHWATVLFIGLSLGSYALNIAHYVTFGAGIFSIGMGLFFPGGILLLAKIKSRNESISLETLIAERVKEAVAPVASRFQTRLEASERERDRLVGLVEQKDALLNLSDPALIQANDEIRNLRQELTDERAAANRAQAEADRRIGELEARLDAALAERQTVVPTVPTVAVQQPPRLAVVPSPVADWREEARRLFEEAGLSKSDIARQVGKSRQTVTEYLNGLEPAQLDA